MGFFESQTKQEMIRLIREPSVGNDMFVVNQFRNISLELANGKSEEYEGYNSPKDSVGKDDDDAIPFSDCKPL